MPIWESGETLAEKHQFINPPTNKLSTNSESVCEISNVCPIQNEIPVNKVSSKNCLSAGNEEGDTNVNQISPSCLEVYYNLSVLSDGERNGFNFHEASRENCSATNVGIKLVKDHSVILKKFKSKKQNINKSITDVKDISSKGLSVAPWQQNENQSSSTASNNNSDPNETNIKLKNNVFNSCTDIVSPSKFLFEYLASKSTIQNSRPMSPLAFTGKDPCPLSSKSFCVDAESQASLSVGDSSLLFDSLCTETSPDNLITASDLGSIEKKKIPRHFRSYSDGSRGVSTETSLISSTYAPFRTATNSGSSEKLLEFNSDKSFLRKRFMDDGGHSITTVADGFFPHPQPGQNLMDFLSSSQFSKTSAQLDKENAHFNIAEAVLAAIEQMNFDSICCKKDKDSKSSHCNIPYESEDDFSQYKRTKIPLRRRPRIRNRVTFDTNTSDDDPVTTDYNIMDSENSSASSSDSECFTDNTMDPKVEPTSAPNSDNMNGHSNDPSSAENVAISLLMHYNTYLLPQANELHWLVTEQDAPQKLLPMPNSVAVSPDDLNDSNLTTLLRGTSDWAPPRPQLILTLHVNTKRSDCLTTQKWRCAGCGLKVSEKLSRHFRLCHYLGRYFCTNCHNNKKAIIPARVLQKWDFKKYPVCNFSSELLSRMSSDPLFHVGSLNSKLYRQSRDLHQTHIYRLQLYHTRIYINLCSRSIKREKSLLSNVPLHWSTDPHIYSLDDLAAVKQGQMVNIIRHLTTASISHISSCHVCLGQGFICEICGQGNPIFPFQLDAVTQCTKCRECFHFLCFSPVSSCPRCARREKRGKMIE